MPDGTTRSRRSSRRCCRLPARATPPVEVALVAVRVLLRIAGQAFLASRVVGGHVEEAVELVEGAREVGSGAREVLRRRPQAAHVWARDLHERADLLLGDRIGLADEREHLLVRL